MFQNMFHIVSDSSMQFQNVYIQWALQFVYLFRVWPVGVYILIIWQLSHIHILLRVEANLLPVLLYLRGNKSLVIPDSWYDTVNSAMARLVVAEQMHILS